MATQPSPERELRWLRRVHQFLDRIAGDRDQSLLYQEVLDTAVELAEAERGFLVEVDAESGDVDVRAARGFTRETLAAESQVSQTVVERVLDREGGGLVTSREDDADVLDVSSVVRRQVLAIACVPMRLRGEIRGVLYLDHRARSDPFHAADLPYLRLFADQAALALETAALRSGQGRHAHHDELRQFEANSQEPSPSAERRAGLRYGSLVGACPSMTDLFKLVERAARTNVPALIMGESGTGKEHVARELHARGPRPEEPFVTASCAALEPGRGVSELFGHVEGAFTGAIGARAGLFREAGRGTLLLDGVEELHLQLQATLLRALQESEVRPLGADFPQPFYCRVIATTSGDLRDRVAKGLFREDLLYRLDVLRIPIPPLRDRLEDVPLLVEHFTAREEKALRPTPRALRLLMSYTWPGNVRQLENEIRRLSALGIRDVSAQQLSEELRTGEGLTSAAPEASFRGMTLAEVERELVKGALEACGGNKAQAARQLGVPRTSLYTLLQRHDLS